MHSIIAIDPGPEQSAMVIFENGKPVHGKQDYSNEDLRYWLMTSDMEYILAIEMLGRMGKVVGKHVFDTARWVGRFQEIWEWRGRITRLCYRQKIKKHLLGVNIGGKDGDVRRVMIARFGEQGTKKKPGPMFGYAGHSWQALAVAVYASEVKL